jgi:hypothetical protein
MLCREVRVAARASLYVWVGGNDAGLLLGSVVTAPSLLISFHAALTPQTTYWSFNMATSDRCTALYRAVPRCTPVTGQNEMCLARLDFFLGGQRQRLADCGGELAVSLFDGVAIDAQRDRRVGVAQTGTDGDWVESRSNALCGGEVT